MKKVNLLFVCSGGYRAELASSPFQSNKNVESRTCGIYSTQKDDLGKLISWAHKIICITNMHYNFINTNFELDKNKLINLDLSDYADEEEIISVSKEKVSKLLKYNAPTGI